MMEVQGVQVARDLQCRLAASPDTKLNNVLSEETIQGTPVVVLRTRLVLQFLGSGSSVL